MLSMGINQTDFDRVIGKLKKLQFVTHELSNPENPIYRYKITLLLIYKDAVTRAMGSVDVVDYGRGNASFAHNFHGNAVIDLKGLGTRQVHWKNLAAGTIDYKRALGYRMKIWEASGDAKRAVRIHSEDGFVGITREDGEAYDHAIKTEFGGATTEDGKSTYAKRGLFTIANEIVKSQKEEISKRIMKIILSYVRWGS